jgi:hypothetical protein
MTFPRLLSIMLLSTVSLASHAGTWTVTTTGTIGLGYDRDGLFGTLGRDLSGLRFKQSVTASTDPADWQYFDRYAHQQELHYIGPSFTDTVTVDGHTIVVSATSTTSGTQYIANYVTTTKSGDPDLIYSLQSGFTSDGTSLYAGQYAVSYQTAFVLTLDYDQTISQKTGPSFTTYSAFSMADRQTWFTAGSAYGAGGTVDSIEVNSVDVPEPGTPYLALAGLAVLGLLLSSPTGCLPLKAAKKNLPARQVGG